MANLVLGIGLVIFASWLTFFLREKKGVRNRFLGFPGADMLAPAAVLALLVFGVSLAVSGWQSM